MTDRPPHLTDRKRNDLAARDARLAQALRDNLLRRKAQARSRSSGASGPVPGDDGAAASTPADLSSTQVSHKSNRND